MKLRIPFERTIPLLMGIPNGQIKGSVIQTYWARYYVPPNGQNGDYGEMRAQAVCWLYCWVMTKGGVQARNAFDNIFIRRFGQYPMNSEFHEWARTIRRKNPSSFYENELAQRMGIGETSLKQSSSAIVPR